MKLVEVIRGAKTSDETVATAVAFAKRIGKMPIVVNDGPGFLVNRLLFPYMNEAIELLAKGRRMKEIDRAATAFGMPMGPITLYDLVGLDTAVYAGMVMYQAFPDRVVASPLVPRWSSRGGWGRNRAAGSSRIRTRRAEAEDGSRGRETDRHLSQAASRSSAARSSRNRLFLPMLLEATRMLEEKLSATCAMSIWG